MAIYLDHAASTKIHPEVLAAMTPCLEGEGGNRFGIGARITVHAGGEALLQEQAPARGFQSSVDYVLSFGLGPRDAIDSVRVGLPVRFVPPADPTADPPVIAFGPR